MHMPPSLQQTNWAKITVRCWGSSQCVWNRIRLPKDDMSFESGTRVRKVAFLGCGTADHIQWGNRSSRELSDNTPKVDSDTQCGCHLTNAGESSYIKQKLACSRSLAWWLELGIFRMLSHRGGGVGDGGGRRGDGSSKKSIFSCREALIILKQGCQISIAGCLSSVRQQSRTFISKLRVIITGFWLVASGTSAHHWWCRSAVMKMLPR